MGPQEGGGNHLEGHNGEVLRIVARAEEVPNQGGAQTGHAAITDAQQPKAQQQKRQTVQKKGNDHKCHGDRHDEAVPQCTSMAAQHVEQPPKGQPTCAAEGGHNAGEQRRRPRRSAQLQSFGRRFPMAASPPAVRTMSHRKMLQKRPVRSI